ncbi:MAG: translocation/assembly module TamB domain-containing protein [Bacteroidaceae bacterium]
MLPINRNTYIKTLGKIVRWFVGILISVYLLSVLLFKIPAVNVSFANFIAKEVGNVLSTKVSIEDISLGMFNRIILNGVSIEDQTHKELLKAKRISVKIEYLPLLKGVISIRNVELVNLYANLYKKDPKAIANYQFILNALKSDSKKEASSLDLNINSLIVRRATIQYNILSNPTTIGKLNTSHLNFSKVNVNLRLQKLTSDSINLRVRSISATEACGLNLQNLSFKVVANSQVCKISNFNCKLPNTNIDIPVINCTFNEKGEKRDIKSLQTSLHHVQLSPSDFAWLIPELKEIEEKIDFSTKVHFAYKDLTLANFILKSHSKNIDIKGRINIYNILDKRDIQIKTYFSKISITGNGIKYLYKSILPHKEDKDVPTILNKLGNVEYIGKVVFFHQKLEINGSIKTGAGSLLAHLSLYKDKRFEAKIRKAEIKLGTLLSKEDQIGSVSLELNCKGVLSAIKKMTATCDAKIKSIELNHYKYKDLLISCALTNGLLKSSVNLNDANLKGFTEITTNIGNSTFFYKLNGKIDRLSPQALYLTKKYGKTNFSVSWCANLSGKDLSNLSGKIAIKNFCMSNETEHYKLDSLILSSQEVKGKRYIKLNSDFASGLLYGHIDFTTLEQSIRHIASKNFPSINADTHAQRSNNDFNFELQIHKSDFIEQLLQQPIKISQQTSILGHLNEKEETLHVSVGVPQATYDGSNYSNIKLYCSAAQGQIRTLTQLTKQMKHSNLQMVLEAKAQGENLYTDLEWDTDGKSVYKGALRATSTIRYNEKKEVTINTEIAPSFITIHDSVWTVRPSSVQLNNNELHIHHFKIGHKEQFLALDGSLSKTSGDSLIAELKDVNLEYVFDLLNFHAVDFAGLASGYVYMNKTGGTPKAMTQISVKNFRLNGAAMGTLNANGRWNNTEKQIDINASITEPNVAHTEIKGYVSPERDGLDLRFTSQNTPVGFLNKFLGDIMKNINGRTSGTFRLSGTFDKLQLEGKQLANVSAEVKALGTTYHLQNDSILLEPGIIKMDQIKLSDSFGGTGILTGYVTHDFIRNMKYDFKIKTNNLMGYNVDKSSQQSFYGTIFATGDVHLWGGPKQINADIYIMPNEKTVFVYNAAKPSEINDTKFITFIDKTPAEEQSNSIIKSTSTHTKEHENNKEEENSDMYLNFIIDANPNATLKVIMDEKSGDYISLNGYGNLRANFYNKGKFQLYGTYRIDQGLYKMTIQDVIYKDFKFKQGGTIIFGGDPFKGNLNLQAAYTVNSANLNDLNIGTNFSNNSVKVDCLLNFSGTAGAPNVNFDLDLPTVNDDEKQMIHQLIKSEEDINMQVIYLLSVGRFYTYNYNATNYSTNQSQSAVAMRSLLSSTLSGQINSMLSNAIGSSNWSFGTDLATGNTGWNDMEIKGLLSGRLLNNRLLINGNFGYRDKPEYAGNFIGDFNIQYLLNKSGNISLKAYSETNDRYFTKSSLTTQGGGIIFKRDFSSFKNLFGRSKKKGSIPTKAIP